MKGIFVIAYFLSGLVSSYSYEFTYEDLSMNPYRELGVAPWSTLREIKERYNSLAKMYHPDKSRNQNTREKFQQIHKAYETIRVLRSLDSYEEANENEDVLFSNALHRAIYYSYAFLFVISLFYGIVKLVQIGMDYVYKLLLCLVPCGIIIDQLFPHYFGNIYSQYFFSLLVSLAPYYGIKFIWRRIFTNKEKKE